MVLDEKVKCEFETHRYWFSKKISWLKFFDFLHFEKIWCFFCLFVIVDVESFLKYSSQNGMNEKVTVLESNQQFPHFSGVKKATLWPSWRTPDILLIYSRSPDIIRNRSNTHILKFQTFDSQFFKRLCPKWDQNFHTKIPHEIKLIIQANWLVKELLVGTGSKVCLKYQKFAKTNPKNAFFGFFALKKRS